MFGALGDDAQARVIDPSDTGHGLGHPEELNTIERCGYGAIVGDEAADLGGDVVRRGHRKSGLLRGLCN
jgi:hypothetical protein